MNAVATQQKSKLPGIINLLLVIALGISLAKFMWLVLTPEKKINTQTQFVTNQNKINTKQKINYGKLIANQHLFGQIKKVVKPKKETNKTTPKKVVAPPVKLNLKLHGVVAYQSKSGFALISLNGGEQKVFGKGDKLGKGATVKEIHPKKVLINNNGTVEELLLPVNKVSNKPQKSAIASTRGSNSKVQFGGSGPAPSLPQANKSKEKARKKVDLSNFRKEVIRNPKKLMDVVTTSPAIVNGEFIGFRIQPARNRRLFRDLGFRPNDIITEVNGIVIDDMSKGALILGELANASEVSVRVKRGNQDLYLQNAF